MKARKMFMTLAACIAFSTSAFAGTDEDRMSANCDGAITELAAEAAAGSSGSEIRAGLTREDEASANCDSIERDAASGDTTKAEADRGSALGAGSHDALSANCDGLEAA